MFRSFIPFFLACLGFAIIGLARDMPLFEWQISQIVADIPPDFHFKPSPWKTRLGESVLGDSSDKGSYFLWQIYTPMGDSSDVCSPVGSKPIAKRSRIAETLEHISLGFYQKVYPWLWGTSWLILFLSGLYVWGFANVYKRPFYEPVIFSALLTIIFCFFFDNVLRPLSGRVMPALPCEMFLPSHPYSGTIAFTAHLSKIHFEMPIAMFIGIGLQLGAIGVMVRQIREAPIPEKESAQSVMS
ncbi:MAG: hypothetical protein U0V48_08515 [Anaerolineales bacterium]